MRALRNPCKFDEDRGAGPKACDADPARQVAPGLILEIFGVGHRVLAVVKRRVFAADLASHHVYLEQGADGSIQLPTVSSFERMIELGQAVPVTGNGERSATERMRRQIDMLDAAQVPQGDKAIWIFLSRSWTPTLEARFGRHDEPWKIRRWRSAMRKAARGATS